MSCWVFIIFVNTKLGKQPEFQDTAVKAAHTVQREVYKALGWGLKKLACYVGMQ